MGESYDKALETASYIESVINCRPELAIILGSGLGGLSDSIENRIEIAYRELPNFPVTSVPGHEGKLIIGMLGGRCVMAMKGRVHYYEGNDMSAVIFPIRVFALLKIKNLIVTNAAGAINQSYNVGDLMLIKDHISFFTPSPLRGVNEESFGVRFPDMSRAYDAQLLEYARTKAMERGLRLREGVYAFMPGPAYETPSEIRALQAMGADAVGMSTVPEVIAAVHSGIRTLGISLITNSAAGVKERPISHTEVMEAAGNAERYFSELVTDIAADWPLTKTD